MLGEKGNRAKLRPLIARPPFQIRERWKASWKLFTGWKNMPLLPVPQATIVLLEQGQSKWNRVKLFAVWEVSHVGSGQSICTIPSLETSGLRNSGKKKCYFESEKSHRSSVLGRCSVVPVFGVDQSLSALLSNLGQTGLGSLSQGVPSVQPNPKKPKYFNGNSERRLISTDL